MPKNLICIYDLSCSPCSYDFIAFLISAELHRKRYSLDSIELVFVAGPKSGFRDDTIRTNEQNNEFFYNVLIPSTSLLKSCSSVHHFSDSKKLQKFLDNSEHIFPRGYSVKNPIADYTFGGITTAHFRSENPVFLKAPEYSIKMARSFLESISTNKKFILLTTREILRDDLGTRSIKPAVWKDFFSKLDLDVFHPLIIRDTKFSFSNSKIIDGIQEVPYASIHLPFRMAINELAYISLFKNNGPSMINLFGNCNTVYFNEYDDRFDVLSQNWFKTHYGMNIGAQYPLTSMNKLVVWSGESTELIKKSIETIRNACSKNLTKTPHDFINKKNLAYTTEVALKKTILNIKSGLIEEDWTVFLKYNSYLNSGILNGEKPFQLIKRLQEQNVIPRDSLKRLYEIDEKNGSRLSKDSELFFAS